MTILLLNYSHPLTAEQEAQLGAMLAAPLVVRNLATHVDRTRPLAEVACELADLAELSSTAWQTTPFVLNPPALAPVALALLAEIHGRCGNFPTLLHVRPVADSLPTRYEIAELLNLQTVRDAARMRR
ncbi:CRISPR-associated protein Csx15 [Candidatus Viridilinea mediisalina]|uniref:CRISPR-associated protein Csx15 n=1 Tax=Candidatus Viridilinea mediisalina TaxID=2024553 RepID=UPI001FE78094|nr:CRISPR-associated protein Csx15 [Candidatus Viridilinea mediisalina]